VWDVRLALAHGEVPAARLGRGRQGSGARLGWTSWLGGPAQRTRHGIAIQARADLTLNPESLLLRQPRAHH